MENQGEQKSRKEVIVERFATVGGVIGFVLGIIGLVSLISDGEPVHRPLLALGIFAALGAGAGWLAGNAVAWMARAD